MHWSKVMLLEAGCAPKLCSWDYIPRQQGAWLRAILPGSERMKASVSTAIKSMHGWLLPGWLEAAVTWVWTWCWWGISLNGFPSDPWLQGSVQLHGLKREVTDLMCQRAASSWHLLSCKEKIAKRDGEAWDTTQIWQASLYPVNPLFLYLTEL